MGTSNDVHNLQFLTVQTLIIEEGLRIKDFAYL